MPLSTPGKNPYRKYPVILFVAWPLIVLFSCLWAIRLDRERIINLAEVEARSGFNKDLVYRRWAAGHGGVYVPPTAETPPNPYLAHIADRDVVTTEGKRLTLMNPAYMTRQAYELGREQYGIAGHITSLTPLNPINAPDAWEKAALEEVRRGKKEMSSVEIMAGQPYLRFLGALVAEERCLKCHAGQGYKEGDVRGGISFSVPLAPYFTANRPHLHHLITVHFFIWLAGALVILFGGRSLMAHYARQHKADEELRRSRDEWKKSFNAIGDIVTIQDKEMRIVRANRAAGAFFRTSPEDLVGRHCYEVFRGATAPCPGCPELKTIQDIEKYTALIRHQKLGKTFYVSSAPLLDQEGNLEYIVHVAKDVTEQQKLESELLQARKMEAIGTLAGGIAHDFNNILAAILGYAELAREDLGNREKAAADLGEVIRGALRARDLVKQILTFSRKEEQAFEPLEPYLIIKESLKLLRASLPATIEIVENIDKECGMILADPTQIQQVMVNLCTNALHAMENEKGVLEISLRRVELAEDDLAGEGLISPGPFLELTVRDTGHGMEEAVRERIFEPYFTTKAKGKGKGTGMGLALVHGIVQGCRGFIRVESEVGRGSAFHVYFPALAGRKGGREEAAGAEEKMPGGRERILVVDDERAIAGLQKEALEGLGYQVTIAAGGDEALEKVKATAGEFNLVITDQTMPHLTGAELAREILKIRPDLPVVLCTGYSSVVTEKEARLLGIKAFLLKPVARNELARTVRRVLDGEPCI